MFVIFKKKKSFAFLLEGLKHHLLPTVLLNHSQCELQLHIILLRDLIFDLHWTKWHSSEFVTFYIKITRLILKKIPYNTSIMQQTQSCNWLSEHFWLVKKCFIQIKCKGYYLCNSFPHFSGLPNKIGRNKLLEKRKSEALFPQCRIWVHMNNQGS